MPVPGLVTVPTPSVAALIYLRGLFALSRTAAEASDHLILGMMCT